ncbi:MAG: S8 family peptidase [Candidatus Sericytochromatia bacterium]
MKNSVRRVITAVALTSLAATMVACQATPFASGPRLVNAAGVSRTGAPSSPQAAALADAVRRGLDHVPGEFLVKLRPGATAQAAMAQAGTRAMGFQSKPVGSLQSGIVLMKAGGARATAAGSDAQALQALRSNPAVLIAEPNYIVRLTDPANEPLPAFRAPDSAAAPNDPMYKDQYAHKVSSSEAGWAIEQGNADLILSIVDTGVDYKHPDLAAKLLPGYNTVDDNATVEDGNGHGTHCAGIAAALTNNGVGVAGFAPNVKILPVQVLSKEGYGSYASVAGGIIWAADHGAKVISMSLGGPSPSSIVDDAVKHALEKDVILIAAAGNSGHAGNKPIKSYPAAIPGVMAVGATDNKDQLARFSQIGDWISISAPGVNILSTFPTYASQMPSLNYGSISGTSMATPAVAGVAALVRSKFPQLNAAQTKAQIEANADDMGDKGYDIFFGHGRINVFKALSNAPAGFRR